MRWINYLFTLKIPFYIYKLKTGDSIIANKNYIYKTSIIILYGVMYIKQIFSNHEVLMINIVNKNNIVDLSDYSINQKSYYKITALRKTYLISFCNTHLQLQYEQPKIFFKYYFTNHKLTLSNQRMITYVLIQKNTKYKVLQFLILLSIKFGIIYKEFIKIPLKIRKHDIADMTGSNINTINKTFKLLEMTNIINYSDYNNLLIHNSLFIHFIYLLN